MFTGLIEGLGRIKRIDRPGGQLRLTIEAEYDLKDFVLGESIAVSGVCLTVVAFSGRSFSVDVSQESVSRSGLGRLRINDPVNLERALRLSDRLGGHLVSGHVDGPAQLVKRDEVTGSIRFVFSMEPALMRYVIPKGSITIDGISLTVNECDRQTFSVNVIPHTAKMTTIGWKRPGDVVNIETDLIGKYVEKLLTPIAGTRSGIDLELLGQSGFLR
ncbi:MAG: riboflavin synthase [Deltaproteobacteria bacterium]|nr:riboflavin synthase [Deltaproteobacteria bacterium]MBF0524439.1 riboflavin synthase [Deltaproteobacteria bacterium]